MPATSRFPLLGEPLALDLVNTRVRQGGVTVDLLDSRAALSAWLHSECHRVPWRGTPSQADLAAIVALRNAIDTLLRARRIHTRPKPSPLALVNQALALPAARGRLSWGTQGPAFRPPSRPAQRTLLLGALAADALALLTGPGAAGVRECAHADCILQFVARDPRRIWCSGAACGNRARVAKHARRAREAL